MNKTELEYHLYRLKSQAELDAIRQRADWQGYVYLLCGVVIVMALAWAIIAS